MYQSIFITGSTGFVGSHLSEYILKNHKKYKVFGMRRWKSKTNESAYENPNISYIDCEIRNLNQLHKILHRIKPVKIFHLAAQSFVPISWRAPQETLETNIIGQCNLFESSRKLMPMPIIQIAGSSEEYGFVKPKETPITEENKLRPLSPYSVSKIGQDFLGYQYYKSYGLPIIRTRAFNHTGPRRGEQFVCSNFAKQIALIEKKKQEPIISVGDLTSVRDFTDVRDMVRAYWIATEKCKVGEVYNIASGRGITIQEVLDILLSLSEAKIKIKQDPTRLRPSDVKILIGNCDKFKKATNWKPEIPFEKTMKDLLEYWRKYA